MIVPQCNICSFNTDSHIMYTLIWFSAFAFSSSYSTSFSTFSCFLLSSFCFLIHYPLAPSSFSCLSNWDNSTYLSSNSEILSFAYLVLYGKFQLYFYLINFLPPRFIISYFYYLYLWWICHSCIIFLISLCCLSVFC